ncbi:xanthine dehydrogenase family protein subunit M [Aquimarina sp. ERC-38]|uniref:FAD binding domain-containing protein n=1 Tax=Aquimarina sp. ERC-38 TaxID=2949996 RepID=UPI0022455BF5|nr:xanthine dehydrogenase family protein subunit M [Aquimarina sp. ERC-38]UZO81493.1 xanthine dehydrogenase family protein subunit M [Aquimarina sp. ERC-38]
MNNFDYVKTTTAQEAVAKKEEAHNSFYVAGGTNLIDLWKYDIEHPEALVDISDFNVYKTIEDLGADGVRLGALVSNADTAHHPLIKERYPLLSNTILAGASAQIRNSATNGGNLLQRTRCYYFYDKVSPCNKRVPGSGCPAKEGMNRLHAILGHSEHCIATFPSDMCVALAALEAKVEVTGPKGDRTIAFEDFHTLPGDTPDIENTLGKNELITAIVLPPEGYADNYSYLKLRDRNSYAFALVSVATGMKLNAGKIEKIRIALGGVAHIPWRNKEVENFLQGKSPTPENFKQAAEMMVEGAVGFEHNSFKIEATKRALVRNCIMALDPSTQRPGAKPSL